jgi:DNA-binding protein HU-beta
VNRMDLVAEVAEQNDLPRTKAAQIVDTVFATIEAALKQKQEVRLAGFGTFATSTRKAGIGRNPRTGAEITIAESNSVRFKPGKSLKDSVN